MITWIAAAAHEVPQELGDFGILIRGGWDVWLILDQADLETRLLLAC